ncbi:Uncharacterized protein SCF082_LOCUS3652 [Durusdinium trenchii]|uniref:Uncharacterized protein n=1 Tax=Durusdinium trenchii TaxID=1381693 RepID=A0ABP0HV95_9DINO
MKDKWMLFVALMILAFVCILCLVKPHPPSTYAHDAKWCMFGMLFAVLTYHSFGEAHASVSTGSFRLALSTAVHGVVLAWVMILLEARMRLLSNRSTAWVWIYVMCGLYVSSPISKCISRRWNDKLGQITFLLTRYLFLCMWTFYSIRTCRTLLRGLQALRSESRRVSGVPEQQAKWAAQVLQMELFLGAGVFLMIFLTVFIINCIRIIELVRPEYYERNLDSYWTYATGFHFLNSVVVTVNLALFSGILWQGSPPGESELDCSPKAPSISMLDFLDGSQRAVYTQKVSDLAGRGVHLRFLLNFWEELLDGHLMPSFDPRRSQTNDVVRQAIIPSSRVEEGGRALAEIWEVRPVLPQNMVTHHWSNSFAHLVGAMLAEMRWRGRPMRSLLRSFAA